MILNKTHFERFTAVNNKLIHLPFIESTFQLKDNNEVFKYSLSFINNIELFITCLFDNGVEISLEDAYFTVFNNDSIIFSGVHNMDQFIEKFPKYFI